MTEYTYFFGNGRSQGNVAMRGLLGARGAHLCEMANLGLPVAPGFCVASTSFQPQDCGVVHDKPKTLHELPEARQAVKASLVELELATGRSFGHPRNPLLISVLAGAGSRQDLSGSVANLGINDRLVDAWSETESPHFVWDSYRRLIFAYSQAVRQLDMAPFKSELALVKNKLNAHCQLGREHADCHIPTRDLRELVSTYKDLYFQQVGEEFPQDPEMQLWESLRALSNKGALIVQATVFSNYDFKSGAGMMYLGSGAAALDTADDEGLDCLLAGVWLSNAQIEDVARGERVLQRISTEAASSLDAGQESDPCQEYPSLQEEFPSAFAELLRCQDLIARHLTVCRGVEFAIEGGHIRLLQPELVELPDATSVAAASAKSPANIVAPVVATAAEASNAEGIDCTSSWQLPVLSELELGAPGSSNSSVESEVPEIPLRLGDELGGDPLIQSAGVLPNEDFDCSATIGFNDFKSEPEVSAAPCRDAWPSAGPPESVEMQPHWLIGLRSLACAHEICSLPVTNAKARLQPIAGSAALQLSIAEQDPNAGVPVASTAGDQPKVGGCSVAGSSWLPLPVWQTALAGGAAGVVCSGCTLLNQRLAHGAAGGQGAFVQALRSVNARASINAFCSGWFRQCAKAMPMGALCCTIFTNSCKLTPANDRQHPMAPLWRLGCSTIAASVAHTILHVVDPIFKSFNSQQLAVGGGQRFGLIGHGAASPAVPMVRAGGLLQLQGLAPALRARVPGLAIDLAAIDAVRCAATDRGFQATPSLLLASGAVAGIVHPLCLHPVHAVQHHMDAAGRTGPWTFAGTAAVVRAAVARDGPKALFVGLGSACARNIPVVALNSFVRVGLVSHFSS